jgi:PPK2 family polyphosphate:nucleotide phosphotransferase
VKAYRIRPGTRFQLKHIDPDDRHLCEDKEEGKKQTDKILKELDQLQEKLYANRTRALLIILQGTDTSGKDGTIRHVMSGVNPQSCQVTSFKIPTPEESAHDFLWRIHQKVPPLGDIGIFNRSHYEDVLVTRVHKLISDKTAERRMKEINHFEKLLVSNGTTILKFFLHISKRRSG